MEEQHFEKIQGWFDKLNSKIDHLVTRQEFENRYQALFIALDNLYKRIEKYHGSQEQEVSILKRAFHDLEVEVKNLKTQNSS